MEPKHGESQWPICLNMFERITWHCFRGFTADVYKKVLSIFPVDQLSIQGKSIKDFLDYAVSADAIRTTFKKLPRIGGCRNLPARFLMPMCSTFFQIPMLESIHLRCCISKRLSPQHHILYI